MFDCWHLYRKCLALKTREKVMKEFKSYIPCLNNLKVVDFALIDSIVAKATKAIEKLGC